MKKFLSLVLALVMTMSLVTISAGAKDFTDGSKINYDAAVDVMTACKVVDGYADGSFNPTATLTRGAAAKIICNMILGPTTAGALKADAAPYKDVPADSTFAGYIAYCAKEGIISGYADGTFKPGNSLTGYAFMKMLLGALGYDKAVEGYEGANWSINVAKRALQVGLDADLDGDFNGVKPVTREEACLYAFNTLQATMVKYKNNSSITVGDIVITNSTRAEEDDTTNDNEGNIKADGYMQFAEKYFGKLDNLGVSQDKFGRPITTWRYDSKKVATEVATAKATYTTNQKLSTVSQDLDKNTSDVFHYYVDGVESAQTLTMNKTDSTKIGHGMANGALTEFFKNGNYTVINTYIGEVAQVGKDAEGKRQIKVNSEDGSVSLATLTTEDWALEDKVLFTVEKNGNTIQSIEAAEKLTGNLSKVSGGKYTIDGTVYELSAKCDNGGPTVGKDVEFYLDNYGYIIKIDNATDTVSLDNLAVVLWKGTDYKGNLKVDLLKLSDGTKIVDGEINSTEYSAAHVNELATYKLKSDGYDLTKCETYYYADSDVTGLYFTNGNTLVKDNATGTNIRVDAHTQFVYVDSNNKVTTYTGYKAAPSFTAGASTVVSAYRKASSGTVDILLVMKPTTTTTASTKLTWVMTDKDVAQTSEIKGADTITYYEYNAIVAGKITTLRVDDATADAVMSYYTDTYGESGMGFSSSNADKDGIVTSLTPASSDVKVARDSLPLKNDVLTLDGVGYSVADDVKVFSVEDSEISETTISAVAKDESNPATYDPYTEILFTLNKDGEVDFIVLFVK